MKKRPDGYFGYERRRKWLRGARIDISLGTKNAKEAKRRAAALDQLLERREEAVVEAVRAGRIGVDEVANAVRDETLEALRERVRLEAERVEEPAAPVERVDLSLEASIARVLAVQEATRAEGTADVYRSHTNSLRAAFDTTRALPDISTDELRAWLYAPRGKRSKPWAPNTQSAVHMVMSLLWRLAIEAELENAERHQLPPRITRSPWASIEPADARAKRHSFLEVPEWSTVLERQAGTPKAAFLGLGCLTGLRIDEVLNLRTGIDVDLDASTPVLHIQPREGEFAWRPKNDNSIRTIPIPAGLLELLLVHAEKFAGSRYYIRVAGRDRPMSYSNAVHWTRESFGAAGLKYGREGEGLTYHSLRHTFASWLVRRGWSSDLVAELMGNTPREVQRTYAHLRPTDLGRVMRTIDALTGKAVEISGVDGPAGE